MNETKELVVALQNLTMDNSNKILALNTAFISDDSDYLTDPNELNDNLNHDFDESNIDDSLENSDQGEIIFTNLKESIEQELNGQV